MAKSDLAKLVEHINHLFGPEATVKALDGIKKLGFKHSTMAGISFAIDDLLVPTKKDGLIKKAEKDVLNIEQLYRDGVITNGERYNKVVATWYQTTADVSGHMVADLEKQDREAYLNADGSRTNFNPIFMMIESGARGSKEQIKQLVGMRGLMSTPTGEVMETPIKSNFKDGLSVFEYFVSTHGARKGQADTALKTANSGYLTRRLVDVAQDIVVSGTIENLGSVELKDLQESATFCILWPIELWEDSRPRTCAIL